MSQTVSQPAPSRLSHRNVDGFSLLEIIVTITIAAILGIIIIQFMGTNLSRSAQSVIGLQDTADLIGEMENLTLDYRYWIANSDASATLSNFKTIYVDPLPLVNTSATTLITLSTGDSFQVLRVVMTKSDQSLESLFTK